MRLGILTALLFIFYMQHSFHCSPSVVPGYLDFDNLPDTNFSCEGKVIGGYYADIETGCQMFHVCTIGQKGEITDIKFLCLNGTVFDQETRVCERVDEVDCSKTEGFYGLNLELYGSSAALSFQREEAEEEEEEVEEEEEEKTESEKHAETIDTSSQGHGVKHKVSTSKPSAATLPSSTPIILHPASTTTPKTPVHPFVPTTTYKPTQHLSHFHSTTPPSIAAFLAINNAFSSSNTNQKGEESEDSSSQYDEDEEEDDDPITDHPEVVINRGVNHHFPVTTVSSQNQLVSPEHHNVPQINVKVHGIGESGLILNQSNRQEQQKYHSSHLYGHQNPPVIQDENAHSKHQLNIHLILNQQRDNEKKSHHGFKPTANSDNKSQFLFSSTTQQPPIPFTSKSPNGYSTTVSSPPIEHFSFHAKGPQIPVQTTRQPPRNSHFPLETNAHQIPPHPLFQQIHSNDGGFHTQTIRISQNPLTFQFTSNDNKYQPHQLLTTPSVAVVATTSSTSRSSHVRSGLGGKVGDIPPVISLTSNIGNSPAGSSVPNSSSVSVQLFSDTTPTTSYDEYQEGDVASDPFFRDVPKILKPSPARHGIVKKKREAVNVLKKSGFLPPHNLRYKRKASERMELPSRISGTGKERHENRPGQSVISDERSSHQSNSRGQTRVESRSKRTSIPESKQPAGRLRPSPFVSVTRQVQTVVADVQQQPTQYSGISLLNITPNNSESTILDSPVRPENHHGHHRVVKVRRLHKQNVPTTEDHIPSEIPRLLDKSTEVSTVPVWLITSTSRSVESSYKPSAVSIGINADNPQLSQNFAKNVDIARTRGRGGNRHLQHQPSESNRNENNSERSGQRSKQRTSLDAADTREYLPRSSLNSHSSDDITSRRDGHRYSDFEDVDERNLNSPNTEASNIRSHRRKLGVSSAYQDMIRKDGIQQNLPTSGTETTRHSAAKSQTPPLTSLPETNFTCADKIPGGYYADLEADCQLFHICSMGRHGRITDNKFLCGPDTRFSQESRTCQAKHLVDCRLSASLYHVNRHFELQSPDDISKYNVRFEAQKIRTKRRAPTASSPSGEGPQPQYNVNNLPKTSFTCGNKPHDGLYADLETRCQVFHFCRTISGVMTLESSFVCPPGKVFNQAEKDCGARKEVVCALYSVPQHSFETSTSTGTKVGNNYHITEKGSQIKLRMFKSPKKEDENYKMKREAEIEASDYYDYVDDNYEAHVAKPINKDMSSENDQIEKSKSVISVEDYDYESENDKRPELHLLEHQENEDDDQESLALVGKVTTDSDGSNRTSSQPHESFVEYTTESTSFAIELNLSESKATIPVLDETAMQKKSDGSEVKDTDDYVYSDENMTSVPENTEQTNHTLEENSNIKNYSEFITLVPSHDVKSFRQSDTLETNGHVKTDANITSLTDVIFPTNATQIILYMNKNDTLKPDQNLEIKTVPKLDSFNSDVTLDEYEYYYDEEYGDSKETKTDSNSEHLPSAKTDDEMFIPVDECGSEKQSDYCVHDVVGEGIEEQMQRPTVDIEENASDNGSSSFNLTTKASVKSNTKPPVSSRLFENSQTNFRTGINEHSAQKSNFTETDIILELFETSTNSSPLEEIERKAEVTTSTGETDKKLFQNRNSDRITSAFLTSQLQKKTPSRKETANFGLVSNEQAAVSHKINSPTQNEHILDSKAISEEATTDLGLVVTTVKPQKGSISPIYSTTSYINVIPLPQVEKSLPQLPQRHADQTTDPQAAQSPFPQAVSILSERRKPHNVFINYFSTPLPPPVVIKSRETIENVSNYESFLSL
ncbi:uncharacterized protein LOC110836763 [Zootermopsis nevadensis]|uniref:uncharacterized protein LOC110836763 n=1 Tax=Zootermopsis nevadensis TaxID=136037 RepID=UPI000B8E53EF|nr:uncharacterized protein LOC110836763 [Zootermopsis nevadensis]